MHERLCLISQEEVLQQYDDVLKGEYKVVGEAEGLARLTLSPINESHRNRLVYLMDRDSTLEISDHRYYEDFYRELGVELYGFEPDKAIQVAFSRSIFSFRSVVTPRLDAAEERPIHQSFTSTDGWGMGYKPVTKLPVLARINDRRLYELREHQFSFTESDEDVKNRQLTYLGKLAGKP